MSSTQNIVILGGGSAGAAVAKDLAAKLNPSTHTLTLVTSRRYFVSLPALVRTSVTSEGDLEELVLMPYADFLVAPKPHPSGTGNFKGGVKLGKAISFTSEEDGGEVLLEGGEKIPYNILVLATGNTWNGPLNMPDGDFSTAKTYIDEWRAKFKSAKNIVLVGGGSVGVEYAGELRDFYPETNVTLVHSQDRLFTSAYPNKFRDAALARVKRGGVNVVLDDVLDDIEPSAGSVTTKKGRTLNADLVIPTWGGRPNTAFVKSSLGPDALSKTGHVLVESSLQVKGHSRIFAVGDIIEWSEQKQAAKVGAHAGVVVANILKLGSELSGAGVLQTYKGSSELILVTFGRSGGIAYLGLLWGLVFGDWFARLLKSKSLLIEKVRGVYQFGNYRAGGVKA